MRVIVTGSRAWLDRAALEAKLDELPFGAVIVHGDCPSGADAYARYYIGFANRQQPGRFLEERHPANWTAHGKRGGYLRNAEMAALRSLPTLSGPGARGAAAQARARADEKAEGLPPSRSGLDSGGARVTAAPRFLVAAVSAMVIRQRRTHAPAASYGIGLYLRHGVRTFDRRGFQTNTGIFSRSRAANVLFCALLMVSRSRFTSTPIVLSGSSTRKSGHPARKTRPRFSFARKKNSLSARVRAKLAGGLSLSGISTTMNRSRSNCATIRFAWCCDSFSTSGLLLGSSTRPGRVAAMRGALILAEALRVNTNVLQSGGPSI